ncbi:hypothetical protein CLF_106013 [Clonorchis sinensis]|uniref:Uncharacterized protein n=1 Tax=Clonorchis sinensis TaxID=79923 RepID=G7YEJ7_CLOSI|nr:hypothetical protein CLF_106013 [Clonorchis sinensis]
MARSAKYVDYPEMNESCDLPRKSIVIKHNLSVPWNRFTLKLALLGANLRLDATQTDMMASCPASPAHEHEPSTSILGHLPMPPRTSSALTKFTAQTTDALSHQLVPGATIENEKAVFHPRPLDPMTLRPSPPNCVLGLKHMLSKPGILPPPGSANSLNYHSSLFVYKPDYPPHVLTFPVSPPLHMPLLIRLTFRCVTLTCRIFPGLQRAQPVRPRCLPSPVWRAGPKFCLSTCLLRDLPVQAFVRCLFVRIHRAVFTGLAFPTTGKNWWLESAINAQTAFTTARMVFHLADLVVCTRDENLVWWTSIFSMASSTIQSVVSIALVSAEEYRVNVVTLFGENLGSRLYCNVHELVHYIKQFERKSGSFSHFTILTYALRDPGHAFDSQRPRGLSHSFRLQFKMAGATKSTSDNARCVFHRLFSTKFPVPINPTSHALIMIVTLGSCLKVYHPIVGNKHYYYVQLLFGYPVIYRNPMAKTWKTYSSIYDSRLLRSYSKTALVVRSLDARTKYHRIIPDAFFQRPLKFLKERRGFSCHFLNKPMRRKSVTADRLDGDVVLIHRANRISYTDLNLWKRQARFERKFIGPGSEPPAMGDTPVLLEGWRVYERTMVQRNRATLPAGRTRPPHEVFIPRACYQICRVKRFAKKKRRFQIGCNFILMELDVADFTKECKTAQCAPWTALAVMTQLSSQSEHSKLAFSEREPPNTHKVEFHGYRCNFTAPRAKFADLLNLRVHQSQSDSAPNKIFLPVFAGVCLMILIRHSRL